MPLVVHWCWEKVDRLGGFFLAVCLSLLHGRGGTQHWHCSRCIVGCDRRLSLSSGLLPLLFCLCGSRRHGIHGGVGRRHNDDLNLVAIVSAM